MTNRIHTLRPKRPDDRHAVEAQQLPPGGIDEDGAKFLAVWALIVMLGLVAFLIGYF